MILRTISYALGASLLYSAPFALGLSSEDIPSDTPIASLVASAKANLAQGKSNDALTYFDVAISRDPQNYLTIFQRGATYLSLGKNALASDDFDRVLKINPEFSGALVQRARINARNANWGKAKKDFNAAGTAGVQELKDMEEAEGAALLAAEAEKKGDWETCVTQAGTAIMVASTALSLRQLRARCRFEKGEVIEGVADLQHVLQLAPRATEPHMQASSMLFYGVGDVDKGLAQIRKCLQSDPDSKPCKKLYRQEKKIDKTIKEIAKAQEKRQFSKAIRLLVGGGEDEGLLDTLKDDVKAGHESGMIHKSTPNELYARAVEQTCDLYTEVRLLYGSPCINANLCQTNSKKKAKQYCEETLTLNPNSLPGLLNKAQKLIDTDEFDQAIATLNQAKEHHPGSQKLQTMLQNAQTLLKRSKTKDYYKVLGLPRDADERQIKSAYRKMVREFHPDKAVNKGIKKEDAEKKMAAINEAHEVLSDPELKARFDRGDDPNDQQQQQNPFQGSPFGHGPGGQPIFFRSGGAGGGQHHFKFQGGFPGGFQFGGM
jgi:DnaJ family protein C protein 3